MSSQNFVDPFDKMLLLMCIDRNKKKKFKENYSNFIVKRSRNTVKLEKVPYRKGCCCF